MLLDFIFLFFLTDRDHSLTANRCYTRLITFPPLTKRFFYFSPVEHIKGVYCNCGFGTSSMKIRLIECQPVTVCKLVAGNTLSNPESHSHCSFLNVMTVAFNVSVTHPRRPRGSQSDREKRRDKSFQVQAKEPWVPTLTELFPKIQVDAGSWLGTKNALYYCPQSANSSPEFFSCVSTRLLLSRSRLVWLMHQRNARS